MTYNVFSETLNPTQSHLTWTRPSNPLRTTMDAPMFSPYTRWIIAQIVLIGHRVSKVDFETEVGLIIVLRRHCTRIR